MNDLLSKTTVLLVHLLVSPYVTAQNPAQQDEADSWRVEEIIVQGRSESYGVQSAAVSRSDIPLQQLPQSVQVLTRSLLDDQNLMTLTEALVNVSGVVPQSEAETVLTNPLIRGFEAEIFIDGLLGYGDTAVIDPSSLIGVERVEVAKGPTSTLYGGGIGAPVGGLINVVTKTPLDEAQYGFGVYAGSFSTRAVSVDLNQPISDTVSARIAVEKYDSDDYIDDDNVGRLTVNPSLRMALGTDTTLLLRGFFNEIEQLEYTGMPVEVARNPAVDMYQFTGAKDAPLTEVRNRSVHATLTHDFSDTLSTTLQLRHYANEFEEYSSHVYPSYFPFSGTSAAVVKGQLPAEVEELTADASLNAEFSTGPVSHSFLAGVTWDATDYEAGIALDYNPIGILDFASGSNTLSYGAKPPVDMAFGSVNEYATQAVYLQDHIELSPRLHLLLSGRYSMYEHKEGSPAASTIDTDYDVFDSRFGLTYALTNSVSLFVGQGTGSRFSLFFSGANGAAPEPETSRSREAGLKFSSEDYGLSGTLSYFTLLRDKVPSLISVTPYAMGQSGEQESKGFELDLIWEPTNNWSVLLNYADINAELKEPLVSWRGVTPAGNKLARIPESSGRIAVHYRFTEGVLRRLNLGAGVTTADAAPLTVTNNFYSDDYTTVDFQASYGFGNYELGVSVANLTDEEYYRPYQFLGGEVLRPGQPRSAFLTLRANF